MTVRATFTRSLALVSAAAVLAALMVLPARSAQAQVDGVFDGDPATTERLAAGDPLAAAIEVSRGRFADQGAQHAVLATVEAFADSLAGAALTADGPLLLTASDSLTPATLEELQRSLDPGATVYVLGGEDAIAPAVGDALTAAGFTPTRLAGLTRVETALAVADEVRRRTPGDTVLLARSEGTATNPTSAWADSMPGGSLAAAADLPIIVTPPAEVHPAVAAWLARTAPDRTVLLGGVDALSDAVAAAVPGAQRLAGPERTATAAAIAASPLWPRADARRFLILDAGRDDGWAYGLSAAGIAADTGAPPLLVIDQVTPETRRLVSTCGAPAVDLVLIGDTAVISGQIQDALTDLDGGSCADGFAALRQFADCTQTLAMFQEEGLARVSPYGLEGHWYGAPVIVEDSGGQPVTTPEPAPLPPGAEEGGSDSDGDTGDDVPVSGTNTQEEGVDEPDIVKATVDAAYVATHDTVEIVDLTGDAPVRVGALDLPDGYGAHELLLDDDVLVVLSPADRFAHPAEPPPDGTAFAPEGHYPEPTTLLTRFDISTPTAPTLLDSAQYDGGYRSARMVDGVLRLVASANPTGLDFTFPADGSEEAHDAALAHNRQVIVDSQIGDWLPSVRVGEDDGEPVVDCGDVFAPPAFSGFATAVVASIDVSHSAAPTSSAAVVAQAETLYASTQRLVLTSSQWGQWSGDLAETVTTEVHSFDIADPAATRYVASGQVDGYVLNSFAISERDDYYRIATTTEPPWTDAGSVGQTDNGITILTEGGTELFEVGRVFGLGAGERIFAVRYLGDIAAVVTFRQIDPLYLVDLTNPAGPRATGELKIPGVSRYLHPLGPDHLLGVGQDGDDEGQLTGVQVGLFDISDRSAPTRVDSLEFGAGASPVEFDHKAFTFWDPLGRAFVPTDLYESDQHGAQAIDIDTAAGALDLVGVLEQPRTDGNGLSVLRTVAVGDTVYAIGQGGVSAHDLVTLEDRGFAPFPLDSTCCPEPDRPSTPTPTAEPAPPSADGGTGTQR